MNTQLDTKELHQQVEEAPPSSRKPGLGVLLFALIIESLVVYWIVSSEVPGKVFISNWSLMLPGVFILAIFSIFRLFMPRLFGKDTMLLTYICIAVMGVLIGYGGLQLAYPQVMWMRGPISAMSPGFSEIMNMLPKWVSPEDPAVQKTFFYGDGVTPIELFWYNLRAWLPSILAWGGLTTAFAIVMIALATLLSRSWIKEERLTFPIVMLPLEMSQKNTTLWKSGLFWIGFGIPMVLESLIALNYYFPAVPAAQLKHVEVSTIFTNLQRPWSAITPCYVGFTPFIIGLAFLASTDVAFSVFFFSLGDRLAEVYASYMGWDLPSAGASLNQMPYLPQQNVGAFMAFGGFVLWRWIRRYRQSPHETWEPAAISVVILGIIAIAIFYHVLGMSWWVAFLLIGIILMFAIALTRVRAESGVAWAFGSFGGSTGNMMSILGSKTFHTEIVTASGVVTDKSNIAALGISQWYGADLRFLPMAFHMESLKIADSAGWNRGRTALMLGAATVLGVALGSVVILYWSHSLGMSTAKVYGGITGSAAGEAWRADTWLRAPVPLDWANIRWTGVGGLITIGLAMMRQRFLWWPFNPVGFVLAHTGTGVSFWTHYFIAWILKVIVLRYGGMKMYTRMLPFVYGIIAGDILTMTVWSVGAVLLGVPVYQFVS